MIGWNYTNLLWASHSHCQIKSYTDYFINIEHNAYHLSFGCWGMARLLGILALG